MNGWELGRALRADPRLSEIPLVVVSARGSASAGAVPDADAFLAKPFDAVRLLDTVGRLV
jgi:CheY-like chemotaxis protein